jgi:hypothetical protein
VVTPITATSGIHCDTLKQHERSAPAVRLPRGIAFDRNDRPGDQGTGAASNEVALNLVDRRHASAFAERSPGGGKLTFPSVPELELTISGSVMPAIAGKLPPRIELTREGGRSHLWPIAFP